MTKTHSLTVGEIIALNHVMSEYPMKCGLETIFNMIFEWGNEVTVQENFSDWNTDDLYEFVQSLAHDIDKEIKLASI